MNAEAARQVLDNPVFQDAFNTVRDGIIGQIEDTDISTVEAVDARNQLGISLQVLAAIKSDILSYIETQMLDDNEDSKE